MLHAETNWSEWILDLVRDLARHLAPREHALRTCELRHVIERQHRTAAIEACELSSQRATGALDLESVRLQLALQEASSHAMDEALSLLSARRNRRLPGGFCGTGR